jgi:hypothetical protein
VAGRRGPSRVAIRHGEVVQDERSGAVSGVLSPRRCVASGFQACLSLAAPRLGLGPLGSRTCRPWPFGMADDPKGQRRADTRGHRASAKNAAGCTSDPRACALGDDSRTPASLAILPCLLRMTLNKETAGRGLSLIATDARKRPRQG